MVIGVLRGSFCVGVWAVVAVALLGCDPGVFHSRSGQRASSVEAAGEGGGGGGGSAGQTSAEVIDAGAALDASGVDAATEPSIDAGRSVPAAGSGGLGGAGSEARLDAGVAGSGGMSAEVVPDAGSVNTLTAADGGKAAACPRRPTEQDESFCYDFESGLQGPNSGDTYDLWPTPQLASSRQLALVEAPDDAANHVLQTSPLLLASDKSAGLGHSTLPFQSATVEFDIWVNETLLNASEEVSWFRYVPRDGDDGRVTALSFRRGQAFLRSESSSMQYPLTRPPRTDGKPTHVSVQLDRRGACRVEVSLDGELVASAPEGACASEHNAFVEYGLVVLDPASGSLTALNDDVSFARK